MDEEQAKDIMWHIRVPRPFADAVGQLAAAQKRTVQAQLVWMLEEGLRREQEKRRRAVDQLERSA